MQNRGHCKKNSTSSQYFKHYRGQATHRARKQRAELFSQTFNLISHCVYPGLNSIKFHSHPLKDTLSVQSKGLGEYNVSFGLLRPKQHNTPDDTNHLRSVSLRFCKDWNKTLLLLVIISYYY